MTELLPRIPTEVWSTIISGAFTVIAVGLTVYLTSRAQIQREEQLWTKQWTDQALERERAQYEKALDLCNDVLKRTTEILFRCPSYLDNHLGGKEIPEEVHIRAVDSILDLNHIGFGLKDDIVKESASSLVDSAWVTLYAVKEKPNCVLSGHADELQQRASVVAYQLSKLIIDPSLVITSTDTPEQTQSNPRNPQPT